MIYTLEDAISNVEKYFKPDEDAIPVTKVTESVALIVFEFLNLNPSCASTLLDTVQNFLPDNIVTENSFRSYNDCIVNKYGVNAAIKYHILPKEEMEKLGFCYDEDDDSWEYYVDIPGLTELDLDEGSITFRIGFPNKVDQNLLSIDVFDEEFGQYYDYQRILTESTNSCAQIVDQFVESKMEEFQNAGLLSGHIKGEYI